MAKLHDFEMKSITGESVSLSQYANQVCLVVNVASQ
jgi:glutathione peroxidase-family protein